MYRCTSLTDAPDLNLWIMSLSNYFGNPLYRISSPNTCTVAQSPTRPVRTSSFSTFSGLSSITVIRNKFSHTLTLLFLATYLDQWPSFFGELFALIHPPQSTSQTAFNPHVSLLFFHLVLEISGEVADQMIKSARTYSAARQARDSRVRDAVRERDAAAINEAVLTIVADGLERMLQLRKGEIPPSVEKELDLATEVVDWGTRTFTSYVGASHSF